MELFLVSRQYNFYVFIQQKANILYIIMKKKSQIKMKKCDVPVLLYTTSKRTAAILGRVEISTKSSYLQFVDSSWLGV